MVIAHAGLLSRWTFPAALAALTEAAEWLEAHGCTPIVESESANAAGLGHRWRTATKEALSAAVDVVVAFGGDGTLLEAASAVAHSPADPPLLGVNLGHLGFLTEVSRAEMIASLDALKTLKADKQQAGGDQQHQRQRDFKDNLAATKITARSDGAWARCFERVEDGDARRLHRG